MDTIFNSALLPRDKRRGAWRDALNSIYVTLDTDPADEETYDGFVRETSFGAVTITDAQLGTQKIQRHREHIARADKDCCYVQFIQRGQTRLLQGKSERVSNIVTGTFFSTAAPYELICTTPVRSLYLEFGREEIEERANRSIPDNLDFAIGSGVGKLAYDHCLSLTAESDEISPEVRAKLGDGLLSLIAYAIAEPDRDGEFVRETLMQARLRAIKAYINNNLSSASLSVQTIAQASDVSARYVHMVFKSEETSVSDYILQQRLKRSHEMLQSTRCIGMTITDVAFACGFVSSSHFSNSFKQAFGYRPSEARLTH